MVRIISFLEAGVERLGLVAGDRVIDPISAGGNTYRAYFHDAVSMIRAGTAAMQQAARLLREAPAAAYRPLASLSLAPPMRPSTLLCSGSNYHAHNREKLGSPQSGKEPEFFIKTSDCVIGPDAGIPYDPLLTKKLDCETELAIVIGKPGRHIPVATALDHVFGYTIVNDVTARDRQVRKAGEMTWYDLGRGKAFDGSAPLGPCIVTADEIGDPQALQLRTRINGELRQSASTSDMIWTCAELIHFFSVNFTLRPGMVIITGTPAGTAWSTDRDLGGSWHGEPGLVPAMRYCLPGDVIESEIDGIGTLRNVVSSPAQPASA